MRAPVLVWAALIVGFEWYVKLAVVVWLLGGAPPATPLVEPIVLLRSLAPVDGVECWLLTEPPRPC